MSLTQDALRELTVPGLLRVGINLANSLLVTGTSTSGDPQGVAPDMAAEIAQRLSVAVSYVTFATAGQVADALERDEWDLGLIAVEEKRAETIAFCPAYVEIEATYLVPGDSPCQSVEDLDQPGARIAVLNRAAYDLYLTRTLKHAELYRAKSLSDAVELFVTEKMDAVAGLAPALEDKAGSLPGSRVLQGHFTAVRQAVGTKPQNVALKAFVDRFIAEAIASGLVAELIEKHGVEGRLQVAAAR